MQKSIFENEFTADPAYLAQIERDAQKMRAEAFLKGVNAVVSGFTFVFGGIFNWVSVKLERGRVLNELRSMDDRLLSDIGLTRGDIEAIAQGKIVSQPAPIDTANVEIFKKPVEATSATAQDDQTRIAA